MAVVLELAADASLHCRFAVAPLSETGSALRVLARPESQGHHLSWRRAVRDVARDGGLGPLLAIFATSYQPDFLTPPPDGPFTDVTTSLRRARETEPAQVARELRRWRRYPGAAAAVRAHPELNGDPAAVRDLLAELMERAWRLLVEPWWPQLRDVLDADIAFRARQIADRGTASMLRGLNRRVSFSRGVVRLAYANAQASVTIGDEGLLLLPSVFGWPQTGVVVDPPWQPTINYPARGIGRFWQPGAEAAGRPLARLLGTTRATILAALDEPASTTGLAARCRLPASTVSEHVGVLRACGLVTTVRTGRYLMHQQTALGTALAPQA